MTVVIDKFDRDTIRNATYVYLTHSHTDHMTYVPLSWPDQLKIHCTHITRACVLAHTSVRATKTNDDRQLRLLERLLVGDVVPDKWSHGVYAFSTVHSPGSVGFFVKSTGVLWLGDGRVTPSVQQVVDRFKSVTTKVHGDHHHDVSITVPPWDVSIDVLRRFVTMVDTETSLTPIIVTGNTSAVVAVKHCGYCPVLHKDHDTTSPAGAAIAVAVRIVGDAASTKKQLLVTNRVPSDKHEYVFVKPSSTWFAHHRRTDMLAIDSSNTFRVYLSYHD
jgi:hypothetical protein